MAGDQNGQLSTMEHLLSLKEASEKCREEEFDRIGPNTDDISKERVKYLSRKFKQVCKAVENKDTSLLLDKRTRKLLESLSKKNDKIAAEPLPNLAERNVVPPEPCLYNELFCISSNSSSEDVRVPSVPTRVPSAEGNKDPPFLLLPVKSPAAEPKVKTEDAEDTFYLAGSLTVPNKVLNSDRVDGFDSDGSMDSDGEYTNRPGYERKRRSTVISVDDEETTEPSPVDRVDESSNESSTTTASLVEEEQAAEAPVHDLPLKESRAEPSMAVEEPDGRTYVPAKRDRLLDFFRMLKEQVTVLRSETSSALSRTAEDAPEEQRRIADEQAGQPNAEVSSPVHGHDEEEALVGEGHVRFTNYGDQSPEIFGPPPKKQPVRPKKVTRAKTRKPEPGPSELSLALQRLLDPSSNVDEELANLDKLQEKIRAEDTLPFGNRAGSPLENSAESSDTADSGTTTEDDEEKDRRFEEMIRSVGNEVGGTTGSEHDPSPEKELSVRSKKTIRNAEMDEEMKLLLNEISATDSEGDPGDLRSVRYRRPSSQSGDSNEEHRSLSPLPADFKVERDLGGDSWSLDESNESFDEFFKLLDAEKAAEKNEKKRSRKSGGPEEGEEESKSEFSSTSASEADDEHSSDDAESLHGEENGEADADETNENSGLNFREQLNANCKMTDEELEAERRELELLGLNFGAKKDEGKKEKAVSEKITLDGENSSEIGGKKETKKKERKALKPRDENVSKRTKPFFEVSEPSSPSGPMVKKERRSIIKKRPRLIESDSDEIPEPTEPPRKKKFDVVTLDSSSESGGGLIFEERKRRMDAIKKKQGNKSRKPVRLPNRTLRKVWADHELSAESRRAKRDEEERRERVDRLEGEREAKGLDENILDISVLKLPDEEPIPVTVAIHPQLWKALRPHQKDGVRFMYRSVIQSVEHIQDAQYQGCILAHSMGLGKTLQVLAFLQAVLGSLELNVKTCLVLCPKAVVLNWNAEVKDWMRRIPEDASFKSYVLKSGTSTAYSPVAVAQEWKEKGGVLVMSYSLYLSYLTRAEKGKNKALLSLLRDPGPDILVCDEAHTLKSGVGKQFLCISQIATTARIALTGTPLQNNLGEYYTMVNFVKPALLGSSKEFKNQFQLPIEEGSKKESSPSDVRLMKQRSGILRHLLSGCLQIRGVSILTETIPPKTEYRITLRLTDMQATLYKALIEHYRNKVTTTGNKRFLWQMVPTAQMITFHPQCLQKEQENERKKIMGGVPSISKLSKEEGSDSSSETDEEIDKEFAVWFEGLLPSEANFITSLGSKATIVREILLDACALKEKVLIFSDRIAILGCLEELLVSIDKENLRTPDGRRIEFRPNVNYVSFDGSTGIDKRQEWINKFNNDPKVTVFLLSIKAAGMGINLVSANRVILVDPSWNPTTDKQALFRAYRYGQTKPVYVYRLVSYGTTESKICDTQLKKDTMVGRVTEEKYAKRFGKNQEDIFEFKELPFDPKKPFMPAKVPTDTTMIRLLERHSGLIVNVEDYDSLLEADEAPLEPEEAVAGWLKYGWGSDDSNPAEKGDPFEGRLINPIKVADAFNANKNRCVKFKCEKDDFVSLETFIQRYLKHVPRNLNRVERIQDTVKKIRQDMLILRPIINDMRRKFIAQDLQRQQQQQQQQQRNQQQHQQMLEAMRQQQKRGVIPSFHTDPRPQGPQSADELHRRYGLDKSDVAASSPWVPVNNFTGATYRNTAPNQQNLPNTIYVSPKMPTVRMGNPAPQQRMPVPPPYRAYVLNQPEVAYQRPAAQPRGFTGNAVGRRALLHPSTGVEGSQNTVETAQQELTRQAKERVQLMQEARQRQLREALAQSELSSTSAALDLEIQRRAAVRVREAEARVRQVQQGEASANRSNNDSPVANNKTDSPSE
ncbi:hypothetical protein RvY_05489 [Ramazzottius varieornatus]|uniref:Uncharacterized protein n=1 Tax=Ramazzottius varieornatus TaxID=947166 RepID=A0A1D1UV66_RAMVA|nr:hypothetical protein RvY_05489 [Ramazzottius varieornatus]